MLQVANDTAGPLSGDADNLCDLDADGVITTTDVQLFLAALRGDTTYLDVDACAYEVPADGSIGVDVTISLSDADRAYFGAHYPNGGYVDGYLYVNAEDGTGKQMSIPLLAYYGNWTEPSMYDKYILLEDVYDETACGYVYDGYENYLTVKFNGSSNAYYYMPNLYAEDDTYMADRNAFCQYQYIVSGQHFPDPECGSCALCHFQCGHRRDLQHRRQRRIHRRVLLLQQRGLGGGVLQPRPQLVCYGRRGEEAPGGNPSQRDCLRSTGVLLGSGKRTGKRRAGRRRLLDHNVHH